MADFLASQHFFPSWPEFGLYEDVMKFVLEACEKNQPVALATLIEATGGSPRPPGTQMAISRDRMSGFLSGGCIEADVALHARRTLVDGLPRVLVYGEQSKFRDIRLQCGASITIAIEKLSSSDPAIITYARLREARQQVIWISDGERQYAGSDVSDFEEQRQDAAAIALSSTQSVGRYGGKGYWIRHCPLVRLILIGGDPTTLAIARLAKEAEFEVILVRKSGPTEPPPIGVDRYSRRSLEHVLSGIELDSRTAVVFADHNFEANKHSVVRLLNSPAGYVGMLGATRNRGIKEDFLRARGFSDNDIARFRSPVGIRISRSTPVAIAISTVAEIISVMEQKTGNTI